MLIASAWQGQSTNASTGLPVAEQEWSSGSGDLCTSHEGKALAGGSSTNYKWTSPANAALVPSWQMNHKYC